MHEAVLVMRPSELICSTNLLDPPRRREGAPVTCRDVAPLWNWDKMESMGLEKSFLSSLTLKHHDMHSKDECYSTITHNHDLAFILKTICILYTGYNDTMSRGFRVKD